ncbi:MAG: GAF domain-containing protein, partial [Anaerolineales bacterium]
QQIREQSGITSTLHNLGVFYFDYGLYERAYELFNRAAQLYPPGSRAYLLSLHNHAWAGFFAGINPDEILAENLKVNSACKAAGISDVEAFSAHVRGMMLYYLSKYEDADLWFATGVALFQKLSPTFLQVGLAWLGRNALARGDVDLALQHISAAMELAELQPDLTDKRIPLWFGYLAHQAAAGQPDKPDEDIWQLLDRAANLILSLGDKLQDAGLRRNYLIRSFENQDILYEWARQRQKRGVSLDCLNAASQVDEAIRDPFKRLVGFGTRLTSQRSLNELPAFIMAEFIELSGAERAYLALFDENGAAPRLLETSGLTNEEAAQLQAELAQAVDQAVLARQPVLRTGLGEVPPGEPAPLHLRSALVLPLVLPERVIGVLVADVRDVFGPFTRADADLLGVLANQAAAALENALLVENLEARVAARTIELNARVDELQILNSIQSGLASRLEFKAIVDLVGDLLTEIFPSHIIGIGFYDAVNDTMDYAYSMVEGQHRPVGPRPAIGFSKKVIETGETLVVNENMKAVGEAVGSKQLIKTRYPQSAVFVPLRSGGQVTGVVSIQDLDHEHVFTPEIVQLLESLANSMSVGLENARLFAETQKLLEETEQRNAELAIINSIQQGLVARLDYQGIIDLVGDELMKIFNADTAFIAFHDRENELIDARYYVDKGVRQPFTRPYGIGFAEISIETGEPLLFGTSEASKEYGAFSVPSPGSEEDLNQSVVGVPIYSSGEAIGAVSVQSYQQNAYDQDDVRLLSTLANSMSLALESARLFEETQKLLEEAEQRNAELAILNSVGEAMAKSLDVDTIARLVGDKVQNFLKAPMVNIALFDEPAGVVHIPYTYDDGEHLDADDFPMGVGLAGKIYASRKPLRLNTMDELIGLDAVVMTVDGVETDPVNSWLGVPIIVGEKIIGGVSVQSLEKYAFSERDEHLLVTLAANMGVALENARLFNETQRLLKETEQRNAELAVINAVQEALAAELNIEGIFEAVGEKLREIFSYQTVAIYNADLKAGVMHSVYTYEKGQRFPPQSVPMNSLYRHIIELKDTLVFNQDFRQFAAQFEDYQVPQGEMPNSLVVVPVGRKKDADSIIYLTLQDIDGEKIFSEDDV